MQTVTIRAHDEAVSFVVVLLFSPLLSLSSGVSSFANMSFYSLRLLASKIVAPRLASFAPKVLFGGSAPQPQSVLGHGQSLILGSSSTVMSPTLRPAAINSFVWESLVNVSVWFIKRTFQPSIMKRKRRMGFLVRQRTVGGRKVLKRRREKGRRRLDGGIS